MFLLLFSLIVFFFFRFPSVFCFSLFSVLDSLLIGFPACVVPSKFWVLPSSWRKAPPKSPSSSFG